MNIKPKKIKISSITIDVIHKDIKNVHLSVYPPKGRVRISAPERMSLDVIRVYAISKLSWIKKQQEKFGKQQREAPREYISRESHYFNGKRYLLKVIEHNDAALVKLKHNTIELHIKPDTGMEKRKFIIEEWYRDRLKETIAEYIDKWQKLMQLKVNEFGVKKMKTKWGSCNSEAKRIWINLELAKKPRQCLEYIIVHEMVHLLERHHNERFIAYMDKFLPQWKSYREELNRLPIGHTAWNY